MDRFSDSNSAPRSNYRGKGLARLRRPQVAMYLQLLHVDYIIIQHSSTLNCNSVYAGINNSTRYCLQIYTISKKKPVIFTARPHYANYVIAITTCLSDRPSVRPSVPFRCFVETNEDTIIRSLVS